MNLCGEFRLGLSDGFLRGAARRSGLAVLKGGLGWRRRDNLRRGFRKRNLLRHCGRVLIAKVTVGLHGKCAAVFVAEPAGDCWNVDT